MLLSANQVWSLNSMKMIDFNEVTGRVGEEQDLKIKLIEFNDIVPHIHPYQYN